ncbi:MAG: S8 family serine peptidase, partial [Phycisphaerae bacterium]
MGKKREEEPPMVERARTVAGGLARIAIIVIVCGWGMPAVAEVQVRWCASEAADPAAPIERTGDVIAKAAARHIVVQFSGSIQPQDRVKLTAAGLTLLEFLGDNAYFAATTGAGVDQGLLATVPLISGASEIRKNWKLHPILAAGQEPSWAVVGYDAASDPIIGTYVVLHADVAPATDGAATVVRHGGLVRGTLPSIHALVIELPLSRVAELAGEDGVQYIEPALPRMEGLNNNNRALVGADIVQAAPYNLDGTGVNVMVYDVGRAARFDGFVHPDLATHLIFGDNSPFDAHSSHVAGTIGGDGTQSGGLYRGMAPGVTLSSYGFQGSGAGTFLYSNPGDLQADYQSAIGNGADIANNSIGSNVCANGLPCTLTGNYGVTSALIDSIVRGSLGAPFRVVFAAGNERGCANCPTEHVNGYHSMAPPACAKNHITVGAVNSDDDTITEFTSWGPTDDGRLKPDIVAPGCQASGDFGVTSCNTGFGVFGYATRCGTSMATPTVTGLAALLLQDFRAQFPGQPDPRNASLKSLLAHNAVDVGNPGPDYQSGYGSVRIQPTIDFMRSGGLIEREVGHLQTLTVPVLVRPGDPELKVTLAWDDIPAAPNVNVALVNDLDLRVFSPAGIEHFPWTLDPANPAAPAVQTRADHLNNMEQVFVAAPEPGVWQIQVFGTHVSADAILPLGLQPCSLAITPHPMVCRAQGTVLLDQPIYACGDTLTVYVADCDLNTSNLTTETLTVIVSSSTEPAGESVLLTEIAPDAGVFDGSLVLDGVNSAGVLQVASGDGITATYVDADNGAGGSGIVVTDTSLADCLPLCDDGLFCNGLETPDGNGGCLPGTPPDCAISGDPCNVGVCNEATDTCATQSANEGLPCSDGVFCNGVESCAAGVCRPGTVVNCDDGVACTVDACNETTNTCDHAASDALCDNGLFCDGVETCSTTLGCVAGSPPCGASPCDEAINACVECLNDAACDDGLPCNGVETCLAGACQPGTPINCDDGIACTADACDSATGLCGHAPIDGVCDNGLFCDGVETCSTTLGCVAGSPPCGAS